MKISKKILAFAFAIAMAFSTITGVSAFDFDADGFVLTPSEVNAGETLKISVTPSDYTDVKIFTCEIQYNKNVFEANTANNTSINFGNAMKPTYYPLWLNNDFLKEYYTTVKSGDGTMNVLGMLPTLGCNQYDVSGSDTLSGVKAVIYDSAGGGHISSEINSMIDGTSIKGEYAVDLVTKSTAVTGTYDIIVNLTLTSSDNEDTNYSFTKSVSVKGIDPEPPVTPEPPKTGDVIEVENKTAVIDDAGKTRFVVSATETNIPSTTAASVLKVTYDNVTKQANLYKLLGVEDLENAGTLTIGSLTVKVILGEDVTEASQVGAVSFVIQ